MRYDKAIDILFKLESFGIKLGLDNIRLFADRLGHPHKHYRSIHVAGTNGKGTVCSTLAAVLTSAGYKTGLFTSPHLIDYRERIRIDGTRIPRSAVTRFMEQHHQFIRRNRITFFETTTAMAFDWFARRGCEIAVVEVGMGGRLDATNILQPMLSIITAIDLDHTKPLGSTRRKIAGEKAGIIKPGIPVVCAPMAVAASEAIAQIAVGRKAPLVDAAQVIELEETGRAGRFAVRAPGAFPTPIRWSYPGNVHQDNLRTVVAALDYLRRDGLRLSNKQIKSGLSLARWPGRFQIKPCRPLLIYDVAHNAGAARGLAETLAAVVPGRHVGAVCAVADDKDWRNMLLFLSPHVDRWYFTRFPHPRSWRLADVREFARTRRLDFIAGSDPQLMVRRACRETPRDGVVLVFGSHFLVGRVLPPSLIDPAPLAATSCANS